MNYNSGSSHLLGAIIQKATKCKVDDFANKVLFKPMDILEYRWYENRGQSLTSDGLWIRAMDIIGGHLQSLRWETKNIVLFCLGYMGHTSLSYRLCV